MKLFDKATRALEILRKDGPGRVVAILRSEYSVPIPQSNASRWKAGTVSEINYWDQYFKTRGGDWTETYKLRFDPDLPLQPRPAELLSTRDELHILDVGAGPLTWLGKQLNGRKIEITAVDPLADEYDRILARYQIEPLVRTRKLAGENLTEQFAENSFGLVFARNCIDHSLDPEQAVVQMIKVARKGGYVLLEHRPNEAENENYEGLHQWNFSMSDDHEFLISSKNETLNMSRKYASIGKFSAEIVHEHGDIDWLIVRIEKR